MRNSADLLVSQVGICHYNTYPKQSLFKQGNRFKKMTTEGERVRKLSYAAPLPENMAQEVQQEICHARKLLDIHKQDDPEQVATKIYQYVDMFLKNESDDETVFNTSITLACAWADCVVKAYGWSWMLVGQSKENSNVSIVSPRAYYSCPPLKFMNKILRRDNLGLDGENDNTVLLLFNMLKNIESSKPATLYSIVW